LHIIIDLEASSIAKEVHLVAPLYDLLGLEISKIVPERRTKIAFFGFSWESAVVFGRG
jgi:hypothetical protein